MIVSNAFQVAFCLIVLVHKSQTYTGDLSKPEDCQSLLTAGITKSGEYTIWINGITPTVVYCDMVTDGGGWTVFQRRIDGSINFYRGWDEYKRGFGNKSHEFWLGLDAIHALTKHGEISLRVDMACSSTYYPNCKRYAKYQNFSIGSENTNYTLYVSGFSGSTKDQLVHHNGQPFSTKDRDNDAIESGSLAVQYRSAWWYGSLRYSDLNSLYESRYSSPSIYWFSERRIFSTDMKIRGKKTCETLLLEGNKINKEYLTWPSGLIKKLLYCDMTTDGGGWTVIQRRIDGKLSFDKRWEDYRDLFGNRNRSFWEGLDTIHTLTQNGLTTLRIDLKDLNGKKWYAKYRRFTVDTRYSDYKLNISGYTGDAGDSMSYHNGMRFSTSNKDHDTWSYNCAATFKGGWWYKDCMESSLNALYTVGSGGLYGEMSWLRNLGYGNLLFAEMKIRTNFAFDGLSTAAFPYMTANSSQKNVSQIIHTNIPHTVASTKLGLTDSCIKYRILANDSRFHEFNNTGEASCDNNLSGWYRFMYNAGNKMLDSCPASQHNSALQCGAYWQGWLNDTHPEENELEANRTVCFSTRTNCNCDYKKVIKVRNCGGYYVYLLNGVPACNQRYCGARDRRVLVSCTDNYIHVELDTKYFYASRYESITLRNSSCKALVSNNKITLGSIPNGCGATTNEVNDYIIYKNEVILKVKRSVSGVILHDESIAIQCTYKASSNVMASIAPVTTFKGFEEGIGTFTFKLAMYKSEAYQNHYHVYPVKVKTGDRLFFQGSATVQDSSFMLLIDRCYSTPNMNRAYHNKYDVIENGCPKDKTVHFHQGDRNSQRFSMVAFANIGGPASIIYMHCTLFLCRKSSTAQKCHSGCSGNNLTRIKRDIYQNTASEKSSMSKSYRLEVGPIVKDEGDESSNQNQNAAVDVKFIVLLVGICALVIVVAVMFKKLKSIKKRRKQFPDIKLESCGDGNAYVVGEEENGKRDN